MKAKAILQVNKVTGQKMLTLTQDSTIPNEDFLICSGDWVVSEVFISEVLLLSDDPEIESALLDTELRSDWVETEPMVELVLTGPEPKRRWVN